MYQYYVFKNKVINITSNKPKQGGKRSPQLKWT